MSVLLEFEKDKMKNLMYYYAICCKLQKGLNETLMDYWDNLGPNAFDILGSLMVDWVDIEDCVEKLNKSLKETEQLINQLVMCKMEISRYKYKEKNPKLFINEIGDNQDFDSSDSEETSEEENKNVE